VVKWNKLCRTKTVGDRGLVPMDHQKEMAYGESNGHVIEIQDGGVAELCTL